MKTKALFARSKRRIKALLRLRDLIKTTQAGQLDRPESLFPLNSETLRRHPQKNCGRQNERQELKPLQGLIKEGLLLGQQFLLGNPA